MALAAPLMLGFLLLTGQPIRTKSRKDLVILLLLSCILCVHWISYFASTKVSTVAVGMLSVYTYPIMTTFIEPLFFKTKIERTDVFVSLIAFAGLAVMIEDFSWHDSVTQGIALGLIAALTNALRNIISRKMVGTYSGSFVMFHQLWMGALLLLPVMLLSPPNPEATDFAYLLILALFATAVAHTMFISSMKVLSARSAGVLAMIQPVYGVILAIMILHEYPTTRELLGGCVILSAVAFETMRHAKKN